MTQTEFDNVFLIEHVRLIRRELEVIDALVGDIIPDAEHATMRKLAREWESKLTAAIKIRADRKGKSDDGSV